MGCDVPFLFIGGLLFWGLPFFANYWLRRRKRVAGASLFLGRLMIVLWVVTIFLVVLSFVVGFSRLEGNYRDGSCWTSFGMFAVLIAAYGVLLLTLQGKPRGSGDAT